MMIGSGYYAFLVSQCYDYLLVSANSDMVRERKFDALTSYDIKYALPDSLYYRINSFVSEDSRL